MKEIKLKTWILWAVVLFSLGLLADYFFWHLLLGHKQQELLEQTEIHNTLPDLPNPNSNVDASFISAAGTEATAETPVKTADNFLDSLRTCAPEVAAQAIATPEALIEYLQKSVGVAEERISIENYHLTLTDGSRRRVHVIESDNTNSPDKKEIRYFQLDKEGYPDRLDLQAGDTLERLLAQGTVTRHESRSNLKLKDGSTVQLETHDKKVFEFQYNNHGKLLSCRGSQCQCP